MKKTLLAGLATALLLAGTTGAANAAPFSNTIDFNSFGPWTDSNGITQNYSVVSDIVHDNLTPGYLASFSHTVTFNPEADAITDAKLTISYAYTHGSDPNAANTILTNPEVWFLTDSASVQLGQLLTSRNWISQEFDLAPYISGVSGSSWTIGFMFDETTVEGRYASADTFKLDKSTLSGNYNPVPEPATMLLLGAGLAGLASVRRKKMQK